MAERPWRQKKRPNVIKTIKRFRAHKKYDLTGLTKRIIEIYNLNLAMPRHRRILQHRMLESVLLIKPKKNPAEETCLRILAPLATADYILSGKEKISFGQGKKLYGAGLKIVEELKQTKKAKESSDAIKQLTGKETIFRQKLNEMETALARKEKGEAPVDREPIEWAITAGSLLVRKISLGTELDKETRDAFEAIKEIT